MATRHSSPRISRNLKVFLKAFLNAGFSIKGLESDADRDKLRLPRCPSPPSRTVNFAKTDIFLDDGCYYCC